MTDLPANVYRIAQREFDAIPGAPWVYWIPGTLRRLFETLPGLGDVAQPRQGLATADNFRFLRYWWEVGPRRIAFGCRDAEEARASRRRWFPYMKGGAYRKWYGNQEHVVNWEHDGQEIQNFYSPGGRLASRPQNTDYYFREGVTFSAISSTGFSVRFMPFGFAFDHGGNCIFPERAHAVLGLLGYLNSSFSHALLRYLNPTINVFVGDIERIPLLTQTSDEYWSSTAELAVHNQFLHSTRDETSFDYAVPWNWDTGPQDLAAAEARLAALEAQIDDEVYRLYGISDEDRAAIEAELNGLTIDDSSIDDSSIDDLRLTIDDSETDVGDSEIDNRQSTIVNSPELAVRWISYAVGVVLGRFTIGDLRLTIDESKIENPKSSIGSAVFRREEFAIGSLPAPDQVEFDALVGPPERFAYIDGTGGRHVFPAQVEAALRALALPDGIAVLDEGHPRDLPALVEKALRLMLDPATPDHHPHSSIENGQSSIHNRQSDAVIELGANGDLRRFLERDFFTKWHLKWYRKRPVYWPLQSAKRSYGFVLFHERIDRTTLYTLQREYLDHKLNGLRLEIGDLRGRLAGAEGRARREIERGIDRATQLLEELTEFAKTMERIMREGYEPAPDWIDDGVILRMAPLWELAPVWKSEPKKYWERLQRGDYDWSHIAMRYWPERVREACRRNKSFAIAHGHEEWFEGD